MTSPAGMRGDTGLTDTERRNLRVVQDEVPFWNAHDIAGMLPFYDEAVVWRNVPMEETYTGKAGVAEYLRTLFTAMPDLHLEYTQLVAHGDLVAEQWVMRGTHGGDFIGIPPTGRPVAIPGMSLVELRDGKFVGDHFYFDTGIVLRQLGLMPPLTVTRTPAGRASLWLLVNGSRAARGGVRMLGGALPGMRSRRPGR